MHEHRSVQVVVVGVPVFVGTRAVVEDPEGGDGKAGDVLVLLVPLPTTKGTRWKKPRIDSP